MTGITPGPWRIGEKDGIEDFKNIIIKKETKRDREIAAANMMRIGHKLIFNNFRE